MLLEELLNFISLSWHLLKLCVFFSFLDYYNYRKFFNMEKACVTGIKILGHSVFLNLLVDSIC